jgi:DNA-binding NarL/FixJ family response regulator
VLLVDDERPLREGVRRLIESGLDCPVLIFDAGSIADAMRQAAACIPQLVVLDVDLAGEDGLQLMRHFGGDARVVVLSSDRAAAGRALQMGACGFVHKREPASALLARLRAVLPPDSRGDQCPVSDGTRCSNVEGGVSDASCLPRP